MSVFYRKRSYMYEFQLRNERYTKGGFRTQKEARDAESALRKSLSGRDQAEEPLQEKQNEVLAAATLDKAPLATVDLLTLCAKRLEYLQKERTDDYFEESERFCQNLVAALGNPLITEITHPKLESFFLAYESKHTANYHLAIGKALFNFAIERGWLSESPAAKVKKRKANKKRKYIPPKDHLDAVMNLATREERDFLVALKTTLARVSEIYRLGWDDIDLSPDHPTVTLYTRKRSDSGWTPRTIPMHQDLFEVLSRREKTGTYVFLNPKTGEPFVDRKKLLKRLCREAGVRPFSHHCIRHYGASTLARAGVPLPDIQEILGHTHLATTAKYIQSLVGGKASAIEKLV